MMRSKTRWTVAGAMALAGAAAVCDVAPAAGAASSVVNMVSDPTGDANFNAPAFQDVVLVQMTRTADEDFNLLMVMAGPVPVHPPLPPPAQSEIWWVWQFDLDPTTFPAGYPYLKAYGPAEFLVRVRWDGTQFAGNAVDRRPLLAGGAAIITPVTFSIEGTVVRADLPSMLIGAVPTSFGWFAGTGAWSGPVGLAEGHHLVDVAFFNP
jgi:hypothetical protein